MERLLARAAPVVAAPTRPASSARLAAETDPARLSVVPVSCELVRDMPPQSLALTYTFEAREAGEPYDLDLTLTGRRTRARETPEHDDGSAVEPPGATEFAIDHVIRNVVPGIGTVSATIRITDLAPGEWEATVQDGENKRRVQVTGATGFGRFLAETAPGVVLGAWPAMVALGAVVGVGVLVWLAARLGLSTTTVLWLAVLSCLLGLVGAKVYYLVQATHKVGLLSSAGMCIQGFVLASLATFGVGASLVGLPLGALTDIIVPGLMFGMALGRIGCWRGGCCAGRLSPGRVGLVSSDRYLLARRLPVQLLEGTVSLTLGAVSLLVNLVGEAHPSGILATVVLAAYILARQLLFPLRSTPRRTSYGRPVVAGTTAVALLGALLVLASS